MKTRIFFQFMGLTLLLLGLGTAQAQRMYDSAGRLLGRVDGERIYDGSGHLIGRAEGLRRRHMVIYFYFFMQVCILSSSIKDRK